MKCLAAIFVVLFAAVMTGCAGASNAASKCVTAAVLLPANTTADHLAAPPANTVQYGVGYQVISGSGCAIPALVYIPTLSTSDPIDISIGTEGRATCVGATSGPATLTDRNSGATALLTCK